MSVPAGSEWFRDLWPHMYLMQLHNLSFHFALDMSGFICGNIILTGHVPGQK
jgi:hypothetical protein